MMNNSAKLNPNLTQPMKRIVITLLMILPGVIYAQQDLTLYNMRYLQQASFTNPSYFGECKVNVGVPAISSIYTRFGNSGFVWGDFVTLNSDDSLEVTPVDALKKMKDLNYFSQEFRYDPIHFGFQIKEKNYIGLNVSLREQFSWIYPRDLFTLLFVGNGVNEDQALQQDIPEEFALLGKRATMDGMAVEMTVFTEVGIQYARKFLPENQLTVGIRPKVLFGGMNIHTRESEFGLYTDPEDYHLEYDGNLVLNTNIPFDTIDSSFNFEPTDFLKNMGFGLDIGATYDINEKIEVSASLTDLGFITWKSQPTTYYVVGSETFRGVKGLEDQLLSGSDTAMFENLADSLIDGFSDSSDTDQYRTWLTARMNLGANYQLGEKHNVGVLLNGHMIKSKLRGAMTLSYNYRIRKWVGFSVNYSVYNRSFANVGLGLSLNAFPLQWYIMTDNVLAPVLPTSTKNIHLRTGFNLTFGCKNDKDKDGIVDKLDECPKEPGPAELKGCPDRDGDGIRDKEDNCPDEKGPVASQGCPDRDGDGIIDKEDECPDAPGVAAFKGCPDTDEDGIKDSEDACPTAAGVPEFQGCPDTDKDGIRDSEDECPEKAGLPEYKGCPDTDMDGIRDNDDACPEKPGPANFQGCPDTDADGLPDNKDQCPDAAGPVDNNGCPYGDRDGDGVVDKDDRCPDNAGPAENGGCPYADLDGDGVLDKDDACIDTPGPAENNGCPFSDLDGDGVLDKDDRCPQTPGAIDNQGCPKIEKEEQEVLNTAFDNLEFETGKDIIKSSSFESLNKLADLLVKKSDWKIQISGHTDNVGNDAANMTLSEKRSKAVAKYLESKGVQRDRMIVQWFGETKPIDDNATAEGRARNRRVEMEIVFD